MWISIIEGDSKDYALIDRQYSSNDLQAMIKRCKSLIILLLLSIILLKIRNKYYLSTWYYLVTWFDSIIIAIALVRALLMLIAL